MPLSADAAATMGRRAFGLLTAGWAAVIAGLTGTAFAAVRSLIPNVLYEPNRRLKVGPPKDYNEPSTTFLPEPRVFVVRENHTIRAISAVCTHLGCTVDQDTAKAS